MNCFCLCQANAGKSQLPNWLGHPQSYTSKAQRPKLDSPWLPYIPFLVIAHYPMVNLFSTGHLLALTSQNHNPWSKLLVCSYDCGHGRHSKLNLMPFDSCSPSHQIVRESFFIKYSWAFWSLETHEHAEALATTARGYLAVRSASSYVARGREREGEGEGGQVYSTVNTKMAAPLSCFTHHWYFSIFGNRDGRQRRRTRTDYP